MSTDSGLLINGAAKGISAGETRSSGKEVDVDMNRLTADLFISLDGFAAGKDFGPYFGYSGPDLDTWVTDELAKPQVLLMGRRTFEVLAPMTRNSFQHELMVRLQQLPPRFAA